MVLICSVYKTRVIRIMVCKVLETFAESYVKLEDFTISVSIHIFTLPICSKQ
jgi:hypothetical protein